MSASKRHSRHERDYIERTIATVRNHRDADNCWPQWANIFADEIEHLYEQLETAETLLRRALPAIEQGERAMIELVWTMGDVTAAHAIREYLAPTPASNQETREC